jgi:hypothetical protein
MLQRLNPRFNDICRKYWWFYPLFIKYRQTEKLSLVVENNTDLVIEGFPRSANSFAFAAITSSQPRPLKIAHHLHHEAQICLAAHYKVPMLILIRHPVDACLSTAIYFQDTDISGYLYRWVKFYNCAMRHAKHICFAEFNTVTHDIASVLRRFNCKFKSELRVPASNVTIAAKAAEQVVRFSSSLPAEIRSRQIAIPDKHRNIMKAKLYTEFCNNQRNKVLIEKAEQMYKAICTQGM